MKKYNIVLAILLIVCVSGLSMSIQKKEGGKRRLNFYLNEKREVESYSAQNDMGFFSSPCALIGKDILTVIPLTEEDRDRLLLEGFDAQEIRKVSYLLNNKIFIAKIIPLTKIYIDKNGSSCQITNFFVKVVEGSNETK